MDTKSARHSRFIFILMLLVVACEHVDSVSSPNTQTMDTPIQSLELLPIPLNKKCLNVDSTSNKGPDFSGSLIINSDYEFTLFPLDGSQKIPLPKSYWPFSESPDHKYFAFLEEVDTLVYSHLIIIDSQGQIVNTIDWEPEWEFPIQWVNEVNIIIRTSDFNSLILLNVITGEEKQLDFPYSDELHIEYGAGIIRSGFVAYSPDMTEVVYEGKGHVFILRDLNILPNAILWAKANHINWASPIWSATGDKIAVSLKDSRNIDDLYVVNVFDLSEDRLTDFGKIYNNPASITIYDFSWSPDNVHLAVQLDLRENEGDSVEKIGSRLVGRLLIVNSVSQQVTDYCLKYAFPPIWSPDGRYLVIDGYIVDILGEAAYKVTDGFIVGWLHK